LESLWEKKGLIVNAANFSSLVDWSSGFTQAPNAVVIGDTVRVYFCTRPPADKSGNFISLGAYVDFDDLSGPRMIDFSRDPILPLGELGTFSEFGTYPISVIRTEDGNFRAYYGGWTRCESVPFDVSIGVAESADGKFFEPIGTGPVLGASPDEPFVITSPKIRKYGDRWVMAYTAGTEWFTHEGRLEIVYKIRIAFSKDGIAWERLNQPIIPDKIGNQEAQASPDITFSNGKYHMFFCYREATDFRRNPDRTYKIGYASSEDLIQWTRNDENYSISKSSAGWDSEMMAYPNIFEFHGETYMLYLGNEVGKDGVGLARLKGSLV
jgi:hypothetical protein